MQNYRRFLGLLITLMLLLPCVPAYAAPPSFSDSGGHWAEAAILRWSGLGALNG